MHLTKTCSVISLLLALASAGPAAAQTKKTPTRKSVAKEKTAAPGNPRIASPAYVVDSALSSVTLRLSHNLLGRFETVAKSGLTGRIEMLEGRVLKAARLELNPGAFESLIGLRDDHIKNEYLEATKYPRILLNDAQTMLGTLRQKENEEFAPLTGTLVVKDVPSPIQGKAQAYISEEILRGNFEFDIKISAYPIKKPNYKGIGVEDNVTIIVDLVARPDFGDEDAGIFDP